MQMQYRLNERLLAILYSERPAAFTDVGGLTGPGNTVASPAVDVNSAVRASTCLEYAVHLLENADACTPNMHQNRSKGTRSCKYPEKPPCQCSSEGSPMVQLCCRRLWHIFRSICSSCEVCVAR